MPDADSIAIAQMKYTSSITTTGTGSTIMSSPHQHPYARPRPRASSLQRNSASTNVSFSSPHPRPLQQSSISFCPPSSPHSTPAPNPDRDTTTTTKWTPATESRLAYAQAQLEASQRRWSGGQEEFVLEVETLLDLRKEYTRFVRRREKQVRKEGRAVGIRRSFSETGTGPSPAGTAYPALTTQTGTGSEEPDDYYTTQQRLTPPHPPPPSTDPYIRIHIHIRNQTSNQFPPARKLRAQRIVLVFRYRFPPMCISIHESVEPCFCARDKAHEFDAESLLYDSRREPRAGWF
ncbi:hypothetical protein MMC16_002896 [Acarospora aff. strigata]|nr:hypothetical protein [Acarospora aff. strigata]